MAYAVNIARKATTDIFAIEKWLVPLGRRVIVRWQMQLSRAFRDLEDHPDRYAEAHETGHFGLDLRELIFGKRPHVYRVLFTLDENTVNVLRILYAAHDTLDEGDL